MTKFDRDGTLLWQQNLNGTANRDDEAFSVAVDDQGNVVAAGFTVNTGTGPDFTVAKFGRDGTLVWQQNLTGTFNVAFSVAVDNQRNVVAAGIVQNDFGVAKFDRAGTLLWQQIISGRAFSVAVDNQGNVIVGGIAQNASVVKFDREGALLWRRNLNGSANLGRGIFSVAVDNQKNVVAAGFTSLNGVSLNFAVAKFDPAGIPLWQENFDSNANGDGEALSVAVDNQGDVIAAGFTSGDFTVAKFDHRGTLLWRQNLNGTTSGFDIALSVAVDNQGNVIAAGQTNDTLPALMVAKFAR